jgi:hypothetical protein
MFLERWVSYILCNKSDIIQGAGYLGKNDVIWGQANSTSITPEQKVNKAAKVTYLSVNIAQSLQIS